ncbi:glutamate--tRNA ligase [Cohaesibacter celericrescens]|uniref:Glutamate--tRNA ligase n=1 Tax=Cohaesibacter celericrescens TaxID=2067669 RepID=A0A2N5XSD6_9HYPH|nr:glutamate--tRNA ligase [Cohaesibacter celericrescens]PLW77365.1 glutamate--tRNA ligase [Cohaesibacter celericrescens]
MAEIVRFAPSPTGNIHIGNARTALINWLLALKTGGEFILRYDDTDQERSRDEFAQGIAKDLEWLGIKPNRIEKQSARMAAYDAVAAKLKASGRLYPCYESADELDRKRKRQRARGLPPVYDRSALDMTAEQMTEYEAEGRKPHWRFKLDQKTVSWNDGVRGAQSIECDSVSDPVLIRGDGTYLYTLPSVIDDIEMGVTMVVRGDDHVTNTAVQIQLFELLSDKVPAFAHHNLLTSSSGEGFSKRLGSMSLRSMREDGYEALSVAIFAVLIGTSEPVHPLADMAALADLFALDKVSRSASKFDLADLGHLNARILHETDYDVIADRLAGLAVTGGEAFWLAVRGNIERLPEVKDWWDIVEVGLPDDAIALSEDDADFYAKALELLPREPWDNTTWKSWTTAIKTETGRKGKGLFMPLRVALTGRSHGPELAAFLPILGYQKTSDRLS